MLLNFLFLIFIQSNNLNCSFFSNLKNNTQDIFLKKPLIKFLIIFLIFVLIVVVNIFIKTLLLKFIKKKPSTEDSPFKSFNVCNDLNGVVGLEKQKEQIDYMLSKFKLNRFNHTINSSQTVTMYFLGNPGCGKTKTAIELAKLLQGECVIINCDSMDHFKFFGASPSLSGYKQYGVPHGSDKNTRVILFDEIDKLNQLWYGYKDFLLSLTSSLSCGYITFANNVKFYLHNVIVIFAANQDVLDNSNEKYAPLISRLFKDKYGQYKILFDNEIKLDKKNFETLLETQELIKSYPHLINSINYSEEFEVWFKNNNKDLRNTKGRCNLAIENFLVKKLEKDLKDKLDLTLTIYDNAISVIAKLNGFVLPDNF